MTATRGVTFENIVTVGLGLSSLIVGMNWLYKTFQYLHDANQRQDQLNAGQRPESLSDQYYHPEAAPRAREIGAAYGMGASFLLFSAGKTFAAHRANAPMEPVTALVDAAAATMLVRAISNRI